MPIGNTAQATWLSTCWKYSSKIAENGNNWTSNLIDTKGKNMQPGNLNDIYVFTC